MRSLYNVKQITEGVLCISLLIFLRELWLQWQPRKCVLGSGGDFEHAGGSRDPERQKRVVRQTPKANVTHCVRWKEQYSQRNILLSPLVMSVVTVGKPNGFSSAHH